MLFSSSAQRWEILKKHVELSIKSQSDTRWESRIKCIKPLRYNLKEVLLALKDLEAISIERKDGRAASETKSLIAHLSKWSFLLSVFIWHDILFQVNKASKILQSYGVSLHTMETEIQATEKFLQNYRTTGYDSAATSAVEIAQEWDIDFSFHFLTEEKKDQYPIPVLFQQQMLRHCHNPLCDSFAKTFQLPGFPFPLYEGRLHTIEESCLLY